MKKIVLIIIFFLQTLSFSEDGCSSVSFHFSKKKNFYNGKKETSQYSRYEKVPYLDNIQLGIYITVVDVKDAVRAEAFLPENGDSMNIYMFPYVGDYDWFGGFYRCMDIHISSKKDYFSKNCFIHNKKIEDVEKLKASVLRLQGSLSCHADCSQNYDIYVSHVFLNGYVEHSLSNISCMNSTFENDELFEPYRFVDSLVREVIVKNMNACSWKKFVPYPELVDSKKFHEGFVSSQDCPLP